MTFAPIGSLAAFIIIFCVTVYLHFLIVMAALNHAYKTFRLIPLAPGR
jgi:hypothetical protein